MSRGSFSTFGQYIFCNEKKTYLNRKFISVHYGPNIKRAAVRRLLYGSAKDPFYLPAHVSPL